MHKLKSLLIIIIPQGPLKLPLQLTWRCGPDMPFGMSSGIQSAVVQEKVYVGGGDADRIADQYTVMQYDIHSMGHLACLQRLFVCNDSHQQTTGADWWPKR